MGISNKLIFRYFLFSGCLKMLLSNQFIVFPIHFFQKTDKHTRLYVAMIKDLAYICLFCYNALQQEGQAE